MKSTKTFGIYWDNIKRFEKNQLIYFITHRIKSILSGLIKFNYFQRIPDNLLIKKDSFEALLYNTLILDDGTPIWDVSKTRDVKEIPYFEELKLNIKKNMTSPRKLWEIEHEDPEISNNYVRFYLFPEAFIALKIPFENILDFINDFIVLEKKMIGRSWSGFNITIRIINWLKILAYYSKDFNEKEWLIFQKSLYVHFALLRINIEKHIPGNHILYQYFVLWLISILFPGWETGKDWNKAIIQETKKQFLEGGLHFELGYHYHVQTTIVVLYWYFINIRAGREIPDNLVNTIHQSVDILDKFILPDGTIPMIGDNCFCFFHQKLDEDIANIRNLSSELFSSLNTSKHALSVISNNYLISEFSDSKLIMDIGELGYKSNPGHGHSDLLAIIYFQRAPVFIDPGTKRYMNSEEDKVLKKSILHNTLAINSENQAHLGSYFRWAYLPEIIDFKFTDAGDEHLLTSTIRGFNR